MTFIPPRLQDYACCSSRTAVIMISKENIPSPGVPEKAKTTDTGRGLFWFGPYANKNNTFTLFYTFQTTKIIRNYNTMEFNW